MNHMTLIARFAALLCARFTVLFPFTLMEKDSTAQIQDRNAGLTSTFKNVLCPSGTLQARALKGLTEGRRRVALGVAAAIGIALSIPMADADSGSIDAIHTLKELADIQLTEKQEACHNYIVHRESSWRADARNGSHHGYYQGRTTYLIGKPDDVQFYWYWTYVSSRYGITEYDEPDMCKAALHLKTRNWQ
jgi:hypothetical protein